MSIFARCALSLALILASAAVQSTEVRYTGPGAPRFVLVQSDGARSGQAPDMPAFALYGDRKVIFRSPPGTPAASGYLATQLDEPRFQALLSSIAPESLLKLGDAYVAIASADSPRRVMHVWLDGRRKTISVIGDLADARARARIPPEFLRAFEAVASFAAPAAPWVPDMVVVLSPRERSAGEPLPWPANVFPANHPGLRMNDGLNPLGMNSGDFASLQRLFDSLKPGQAVFLRERNWAVSYRLKFPYEDAWGRESLRELVKAPPRGAATPGAAQKAETPAEPCVVFEVLGGLRGGDNSPVFALYTDRRVIFRAPHETAPPSGYLSALLPDAAYQALLARIAPEALAKLDDSYDAITGTDPVANVIHVWINGRRKTVSVTGHLWGGNYAGGRAKTPPQFLRAYDAIVGFGVPASPWLPPTIEVLLWPREHFQETTVPWPQGLPSIEDARVYESGLHRVSLPARQFDALRKLLPREHEGKTVTTGNRRWTVGYRLPFPLEHAWVRQR